jgi:hypothetical protein
MTSEIGLWEHARYTTPRTEHGYCTDDNARALVVVSRQPNPSPILLGLARTYLAFVEAAALVTGGFHNRRREDGEWADDIGSDDSQGRAIWSLGTAARLGPEPSVQSTASRVLEMQLPFTSSSPRANAFAVLGAAEAVADEPGDGRILAALERWVDSLHSVDDPKWPWPESRLAYDNARLPEALIAAGEALDAPRLVGEGLDLLAWLMSTETRDGRFSFTPVGGWAIDEPRPGFDQQPVEATAMADACIRAWLATGQDHWRDGVLRAAGWLMGDNDVGAALYDVRTGGCGDGLTPDGVNLNQGAESTLAALSTLQQASKLV